MFIAHLPRIERRDKCSHSKAWKGLYEPVRKWARYWRARSCAPPRMELPAQEEVLLREQKRGRQSLKGGRGTAGVASGEPTKSPQIFKCD